MIDVPYTQKISRIKNTAKSAKCPLVPQTIIHALIKIAPRNLIHAYLKKKTERRTLDHVVTFTGGIDTLGIQLQHLCHLFGIYHCFLRKWISYTNCTVVLSLKIIVIEINDVNSGYFDE
jgi:hypothetical protein